VRGAISCCTAGELTTLIIIIGGPRRQRKTIAAQVVRRLGRKSLPSGAEQYDYPRVYSSIQIGEAANSELLWRGNNKFGSLWQRNCVGCFANWAGHAHLCLWYLGRGFSHARNLKGLHAVYAVVESFHRGTFFIVFLGPQLRCSTPRFYSKTLY
jgi:hypothetical protein